MRLISFGEISIYLIYPLLIPISRLMNNKTPVLFKIDYGAKPFISTILMFLGEMIGGCLFFVNVIKTKNTKQKPKAKTRESITSIINKSKLQAARSEAHKFIKYSFITLIYVFSFAFFDFIGSTVFYSLGTREFNYLMRTFQIFIYAFLSFKLLHYKVYYHQYLSTAMIIIGVIIVNIFIVYI